MLRAGGKHQCILCLAVTLELNNRKVMDWAIDWSEPEQLAIEAFIMSRKHSHTKGVALIIILIRVYSTQYADKGCQSFL